MRRLHRISILGLGVAFAWPCAAQETQKSADADALYASSEAETLFRKGHDLMAKAMFREACEAFTASDRLEPGLGTKLSLADCNERDGKLMTAWLLFLEVERLARQAKRKDREDLARSRATALTLRIPKAIITFEEPTATNVEVELDGLPVGASMYGRPVPVDPGKHVLTARAAGFHDWSGDFLVSEGSVVPVKVQPLVAKPPPPPPPPPPAPPPPPPPPPPVKTIPAGAVAAWSVGAIGVGIAALGGTLLALPCEKPGCPSVVYDAGTDKSAMIVLGTGIGLGVIGGFAGLTIWGSNSSRSDVRSVKRGVSGVFIDAGPMGASLGLKGVF